MNSSQIQNDFKQDFEESLVIARKNKKTNIKSIFDNEEDFFKAKATDFLSLTESKVEKSHILQIGKEIFSLLSEHNFHRKLWCYLMKG